jgi:hypothetical protein
VSLILLAVLALAVVRHWEQAATWCRRAP